MGGVRIEDPGGRAVRFIERLTLSDDFRGQPFRLRHWQANDIIRPLFGTLNPDGTRQYRRCLIFLPRKQAKTQLSAAIALYSLLGAGRQGQTILLAASDREQAGHLYVKVVEMIEADPFLEKRVKILDSRKQIATKKGGNVLKVLAADGRRQHGHNPSVVILDEVHTQPNRKLHDALASAFGARAEPLMILISTAGNDRESLIHDEYEYACQVRDGLVDDPTYLPIIYEASPDDDWTSEATWAKAMPALSLEPGDGGFISVEHFRNQLARAKADPSEESVFKQFHLNLWVAGHTKWLNREAWDECGKQPVDREALKAKVCYGGLDMSNSSDVTGFVLTFPMGGDVYKVVPYFWIPRQYAEKQDARGQTKYLEWARLGLITLTDGYYIDHDAIIEKIVETSKVFKIKKIRADPFQAAQIMAKLKAKGLPVEMMPQTYKHMSECSHRLKAGASM
jgi:phage terminase large subunit-like protein